MRLLLASLALLLSTLPGAAAPNDWRGKVEQQLPLMGHRNWIVIVDSAFPLSTAPGVETVETNMDLPSVLHDVLGAVQGSRHVRPVVFLDAELPFVPESDAPGVTKYRSQLKTTLSSLPIQSVLHEKMIHDLNHAATEFHVLVLKTTLTIPYTSVFLRLDCGYWSDASENKMRDAMRKPASSTH